MRRKVFGSPPWVETSCAWNLEQVFAVLFCFLEDFLTNTTNPEHNLKVRSTPVSIREFFVYLFLKPSHLSVYILWGQIAFGSKKTRVFLPILLLKRGPFKNNKISALPFPTEMTSFFLACLGGQWWLLTLGQTVPGLSMKHCVWQSNE